MADVVTERVVYQSENGAVGAYLAKPAEGAPWPAVLVAHDRQGVWEHMEDTANRLAQQSYLAVLPDMFWRDPVRQSLNIDDMLATSSILNGPDFEEALKQFPAEKHAAMRRAADWFNGPRPTTAAADFSAGIGYLKSRPDVRPDAVALLGYCMGGSRVAETVGGGADVAAAVIYYGSFSKPEEQAARVRCPVQGHYGLLDKGITGRVPATQEAMRAAGKDYTPYTYEDAPHAFANFLSGSHRPEAARLSWERTTEFLQRHLKGVPAGAR